MRNSPFTWIPAADAPAHVVHNAERGQLAECNRSNEIGANLVSGKTCTVNKEHVVTRPCEVCRERCSGWSSTCHDHIVA
jgi:hypothetical protein